MFGFRRQVETPISRPILLAGRYNVANNKLITSGVNSKLQVVHPSAGTFSVNSNGDLNFNYLISTSFVGIAPSPTTPVFISISSISPNSIQLLCVNTLGNTIDPNEIHFMLLLSDSNLPLGD